MGEAEETVKTATEPDVLDYVLGGGSHSPECNSDHAEELPAGTETAPMGTEQLEAPEEVIFEDEEEGHFEDSAKPDGKEPDGEKPTAATSEEKDAKPNETTEKAEKRIHDAQKAMHEATTRAAELAKERDALKAELEDLKRKSDDDGEWFSDEDANRVKELEGQVSATESKLDETRSQEKEIEQKAAEAIWDAAAAKVREDHPDFDDVVYGQQCPKLDPANGDARIKALWEQHKDKSPAGAYAFMKRAGELLAMQDDPEGYRAKIRAEVVAELNKKSGIDAVTGKEGQDLLNSADNPEGAIERVRDRNQAAIDFVQKLKGMTDVVFYSGDGGCEDSPAARERDFQAVHEPGVFPQSLRST